MSVAPKAKHAVLLCGTFNPVTLAHLWMGRRAAELIPDADLIYVPSSLRFMRDWKQVDTTLLTDEERLMLLEQAAKREIPVPEGHVVSVCTIEAKGEVDGRTWNTVQYLREHTDYTDFTLCMGTDKLQEIGRWYMARELYGSVQVLIFGRGELEEDWRSQLPEVLKQSTSRVLFAEDVPDVADVSSTQVRDAFRDGQPWLIREMLDAGTYNYLVEKNL